MFVRVKLRTNTNSVTAAVACGVMSKEAMRIIIKTISLLFLIVLIAMVAWYSISYFPYLSQLQEKIKESKTEYSGDMSTPYGLALAAETKKGIAYYTARSSYHVLSFQYATKKSKTKWHLNQILWYLSNSLHFNDQEIFYLWLHFSRIDKLSISTFNKPFKILSFEQKAQVIGMVKAPQAYAPETERGRSRLEWVLKQYAAHNK